MSDCAMVKVELEIIAAYSFLELMRMTDVVSLLNILEYVYLQEMVQHIIQENR